MVARRRIDIPNVTGTTTGGAPPTVGNVAWVPADGDNEDHQWDVQGAIDLSDVGVQGDTALQGAITMPAVAAAAGTAARGAITMPAVATNSNTNLRGQIRLVYTVTDMLPKHDTYLDEASPSTTFGTATNLLAKTNAAVGNNRQHTYISFDMTGVSGTVDSATVSLRISTTAALGENATYTVFTHPSRPFQESVATWNNAEPPPGTSRGTIVQAVTTTPTNYTLTFDATMRANMPGNWVYLRCIGTSALGLNTITTVSKESGTTANRPRMTFTVTV